MQPGSRNPEDAATSSHNGLNTETNNFQPHNEEADDEIVQVVYQSNNSGSLVGVESSLITGAPSTLTYDQSQYGITNAYNPSDFVDGSTSGEPIDETAVSLHQPLVRASSTLPSVAEESSSGAGPNLESEHLLGVAGGDPQCLEERTSRSISQANEEFAMDEQQTRPIDPYCVPHGSDLLGLVEECGTDFRMNPHAIYSTINKSPRSASGVLAPNYSENLTSVDQQQQQQQQQQQHEASGYGSSYRDSGELNNYDPDNENNYPGESLEQQCDEYGANRGTTDEEKKDIEEINAEICQIISRQKQGAAESGSLKNNFKKKLVISTSTNENDLTAHRQKLLESQDANNDIEAESLGNLPKYKRTHSVSFNVGSSRNSRHSVDIRNLPSYLTVKRASIVDVAKGAMSSLMHSFGSGTASSNISRDSRRDSASAAIDEEPIFEEPIAPTLSLGQRVALVKNNGAEFGTVGWIGQLPDVDDDWVVGVIFDNMIGNCDGEYNGIRYFYSRENYAMFVPLSVLTKTDNYIGRPETGTMLSRMSVSLKPGQLISIQRSSIRLQHCFLNAPHQRVGHDVRAVSNRLHCQCHNCGPCAHLTKQHSRVNALPAFGAHHAVNKKNSLAHAAVEILAHHHHHYHEEEHHEEEDYQFGDNAAHACNFVRYSCCQQNGGTGHEFSSDCGLVRPELLDNLIHAPRAPHRRSARPRRIRKVQLDQPAICAAEQPQQNSAAVASNTLESSTKLQQIESGEQQNHEASDHGSRSCSSCSSSRSSLVGGAEDRAYSQNTNSFKVDSPNYFQGSTIYNTIESRLSLHDQQRFIYQRESQTTSVRSRRDYDGHDDDYDEAPLGLIPRLRRCFGCLKQREEGGRRRRPKKRKLSARNRLIEYRRKQSTFVPSTLAKPQDDFASHGISLPGTWDPNSSRQENAYNSDYSSYSNSSGSNSHSPRRAGAKDRSSTNQYAPEQQFISIDHDVQPSGEQLKSPNTGQYQGQLNYDDYTFDNDRYEKFAHSQESDLGYFDLMTNSSGDTLKNIVDQAIEREESLQQLVPIDTISPIQTESVSNSCCDQVEISSPTISMVDQDVNELSDRLEALGINQELATNTNQQFHE